MAKKGVIGTAIKIEGADEYNRQLKKIQSNLSEFRSELKSAQTQYATSANTAEALAKKEEIISKQYEEAKKRVEIYSKALADSTEEYNKRKAAMDEQREKLEKERVALEQVEKELGKTSVEYQLQEARVKASEAALKSKTKTYDEADQEMTKYRTALNNATAEEMSYGNQLKETRQYLDEANNSTLKIATSIDEFGNKTEKAGSNLTDIEGRLKSIIYSEAFSKIREGADRVMESLMECAETAERFEESIAKVQSIAQVSRGELTAMSSDIRKVAVDMGMSASEVAEATYQAISASVDAGEAVKFVGDAAKLAKAGFTENATAVDVLTTAINAYGKEANTTQHIADDLVTTQNLGKTTVNELAESMGAVIPTASALNVSLDQLSSAYVILTRNGINTAESSTYIKGMLNELSKSGSDTAKVLYNETGHSFGELMQMGYSLGDVLQILGDSVDGNSERFKNLFSNVRAGTGALSIMNTGADEFNSVLETMESNAGATEKAFRTMGETAEMTNARFESSVENLKISIGESLSPTIQSIKELGMEAIEPMTDFIESNPALVAAITGAAAALTVGTTALTSAAVAASLLKAVLGDFSGVAILAAAGVTAGIGALVGYAISASSAKDETELFAEAVKKSAEETAKASNEAEKNREAIESQGKYYEDLKKKLIALNEQEQLDAEEKRELKRYVLELNAAYPSLNLQIDENTGKLKTNTDEWERNIEAQQEQSELAALQEELAAKTEELTAKTNDLSEAEQMLIKNKDEQAVIDGQLLDITENLDSASQNQLDTMQELYAKGDELVTQEATLTETRDGLIHETEALSSETEALREKIADAMGVTAEQIDLNGQLTESMDGTVASYHSAEEAAEAQTQAWEDASAAIEKQTGLLDEWNTQAEATFSEMQERWQGQNEGLDQYAEDLAYVKQIIDDNTNPALQDLAMKMVELDDAATLHEFVTGIQEAGGDVTELTNLWQEHIDKMQEVEGIYASIQLQDQGYVEESTALFDEYYGNRSTALDTQLTYEVDAMTEHGETMTQLTMDTISDMADAVSTQDETLLRPAIDAMAQGAINTACQKLEIPAVGGQSGVFYKIGNDGICGGLEAGIKAGTSKVTSAIQSMVQQAINSVDVGSIVSQIDQKLGAAMGG